MLAITPPGLVCAEATATSRGAGAATPPLASAPHGTSDSSNLDCRDYGCMLASRLTAVILEPDIGSFIRKSTSEVR